jgi:hypothetical protein
MKTLLKEYLHLYNGCTILFNDGSTATLMCSDGCIASFLSDEHNQCGHASIDSPLFGKPILRPLSDINLDEMQQFFSFTGLPKDCKAIRVDYSDHIFQFEYVSGGAMQSTHSYLYHLSPKQFHWLLTKHFDLFGLIEAGLALDKSKILQQS